MILLIDSTFQYSTTVMQEQVRQSLPDFITMELSVCVLFVLKYNTEWRLCAYYGESPLSIFYQHSSCLSYLRLDVYKR